MQIHAHPVDSKPQVTNNEVILGPFGNMGALVKDALQVEYEMTGPVIHFREFRRDVEVTHWGSNLAVEDHYNFVNRGAGYAISRSLMGSPRKMVFDDKALIVVLDSRDNTSGKERASHPRVQKSVMPSRRLWSASQSWLGTFTTAMRLAIFQRQPFIIWTRP